MHKNIILGDFNLPKIDWVSKVHRTIKKPKNPIKPKNLKTLKPKNLDLGLWVCGSLSV